MYLGWGALDGALVSCSLAGIRHEPEASAAHTTDARLSNCGKLKIQKNE